MKINYKRIIIIICIILIIRFSDITHHLSFENLKQNREYLLALVQVHYVPSVIAYILLYIITVALSLPVAAPLTLIAGFLFGTTTAVLFTNIGATIGATIIFLFVRYYYGNTIQKKYQSRLTAFNANIAAYGSSYLLLARLIVFMPFFMVNILAGLTRIPLSTFIWTTSLGIIPGSLVYAYAGKHIGMMNQLADVFSGRVIMAFALLIGIGLISLLIKKQLKKRRVIYE